MVFLRPPWTKALRMRHRSGKTLVTRSRAFCFPALGLPLIHSVLLAAISRLSSQKCVLDHAILARSVTAWFTDHNRTFSTKKGIILCWHLMAFFKPLFILDLWMITLLPLWNRSAFCLLPMERILAWKTTIVFTFKVNWSFVSPYCSVSDDFVVHKDFALEHERKFIC